MLTFSRLAKLYLLTVRLSNSHSPPFQITKIICAASLVGFLTLCPFKAFPENFCTMGPAPSTHAPVSPDSPGGSCDSFCPKISSGFDSLFGLASDIANQRKTCWKQICGLCRTPADENCQNADQSVVDSNQANCPCSCATKPEGRYGGCGVTSATSSPPFLLVGPFRSSTVYSMPPRSCPSARGPMAVAPGRAPARPLAEKRNWTSVCVCEGPCLFPLQLATFWSLPKKKQPKQQNKSMQPRWVLQTKATQRP